MNNEPVAWMAVNELNGSYSTFTNDQKQRLLPHVSQCYGKWIPLYTHPYKSSKSEVDALLDNADYVVGIMRKEIEEWKRKYKDMHNLATQAMSKVHQLEKEAQEK